MSMFAGERLRLKCPQCGSRDYSLGETFEETVLYTIVNGTMPAKADDHLPGASICLFAECHKCPHKWKPRGTSLPDVLQ